MKYWLIICVFFTSCARIPVQTVELSEALKDEGERMHLLNLTLVDKLFQEKKYLINEFITNEYIPAYITNFKKLLPANVDFKTDFGELVQAMYPQINLTKDSLINVLQEQRNGITDKLNKDYKVYSNAFTEMQNLLRSAVKVNQQRAEVFQQVKALSGNRINIEAIDKALDKFIKDTGDIGGKAVLLTNTINSLLK